jgi:nucleoside-diphosphate-sugar epimerase
MATNEAMLSHINVGTGQAVTIAELAESIAQITGFSGKAVFVRLTGR